MSKRPAPVDLGPEPTVTSWSLWRDAMFRLDLMEHRAAEMLRHGMVATRIVVERPTPDLIPDLWTPGAGLSGVLLGPDGNPLGSPSG